MAIGPMSKPYRANKAIGWTRFGSYERFGCLRIARVTFFFKKPLPLFVVISFTNALAEHACRDRAFISRRIDPLLLDGHKRRWEYYRLSLVVYGRRFEGVGLLCYTFDVYDPKWFRDRVTTREENYGHVPFERLSLNGKSFHHDRTRSYASSLTRTNYTY